MFLWPCDIDDGSGEPGQTGAPPTANGMLLNGRGSPPGECNPNYIDKLVDYRDYVVYGNSLECIIL